MIWSSPTSASVSSGRGKSANVTTAATSGMRLGTARVYGYDPRVGVGAAQHLAP